MRRLVVDTFAGPGGWDEGARLAGVDADVIGYEWSRDAAATAEAAGHARVVADVSEVEPVDAWGHMSSPPCTKFSTSGSGVGRLFLPLLAEGVARIFAGEDCRAEIRDQIYPLARLERDRANRTRRKPWSEARVERAARDDAATTVLVLEPARWIAASPSLRWVALEQVPPVLPLWETYARELQGRGWRTWQGILCAADYGVPQTRRRAILTASRDVQPRRPEPTHEEDPGDSILPLLPWVSMAEALGWGFPEPSPTVSSGGTGGGGGVEVFANAKARERLRLVTNQGSHGEPYSRDVERPAPTLTTNVRLWYVNGSVAGDARISPPGHRDRAGGERQHEHSIRVTVEEAACLQGFPEGYPWQGSSTSRYTQVGNAVPPPLAAHVLASLLR